MNKRDVAPKDVIRLKEAVSTIAKFTGNEICADCQYSRSLWASVNFGVFLCSECAGIHRGLGVHITQVRSVTLDDWTPSQVFSVLVNGNFFVNRFLLKHNKNNRKIAPDMDPNSKTRFIQDKYENERLGSREGLLVVSRDLLPKLDVDLVMSMYENAIENYNKKANHVELRYEYIRRGGYENMAAIPRDIPPIYLKVPSFISKKAPVVAVMNKSFGLGSPQQESQVEQLVDLDFGEMTSAPPPLHTKSSGMDVLDFVDFGMNIPPLVDVSVLNDLFAGFGLKDNNAITCDVVAKTDASKADDWPTTKGPSNGTSFFEAEKSDNIDLWPVPKKSENLSVEELELTMKRKREVISPVKREPGPHTDALFPMDTGATTSVSDTSVNSDSPLFSNGSSPSRSDESISDPSLMTIEGFLTKGDFSVPTSFTGAAKPSVTILGNNGNATGFGGRGNATGLGSNGTAAHSLDLLDFPGLTNNGTAKNPVSSSSFPQLNPSSMTNVASTPSDDKDFILSLYGR